MNASCFEKTRVAIAQCLKSIMCFVAAFWMVAIANSNSEALDHPIKHQIGIVAFLALGIICGYQALRSVR